MRLGRFSIVTEHYKNTEFMLRLQSDMAVLDVRIDINRYGRYEFLATGKMFDDIHEHQVVPEYEVIYNIDSDTITFTRV